MSYSPACIYPFLRLAIYSILLLIWVGVVKNSVLILILLDLRPGRGPTRLVLWRGLCGLCLGCVPKEGALFVAVKIVYLLLNLTLGCLDTLPTGNVFGI